MLEAVKQYLSSRRLAYQRTFEENSIDATIVLKDLARFCRANDSTFHADPRMHAVLEGRREVWLRIAKHVQFSDEQFWKTYSKGLINE